MRSELPAVPGREPALVARLGLRCDAAADEKVGRLVFRGGVAAERGSWIGELL